MKYPTSTYAEALAEAITAGVDAGTVEKNFMVLLRAYGDEAHLQKILTEAERFLRQKDGTKHIMVHLARKQTKPVRELVAHLVGPHDAVEEQIDPALVAGMKVVVNDEAMYDGSLRAKLDKIFR